MEKNKYKAKKVNGKKIDEHRLIMEKYLRRKLKSHEIVHHIDRNKSNNKINNLMLFPTKSAHTKYHLIEGDYCLKAGENKKELVDGKLQCHHCKEYKKIKEFQKSKIAHLGVIRVCKPCRNEQVRLYKIRKYKRERK